VETAAIGVNPWSPDNAILCVGFLKEDRKHHALQLQLAECRRRPNGAFDVYHHGMIGGRAMPAQLVFEAIRDHGREDLLYTDSEGRTRIYLGRLPQLLDDDVAKLARIPGEPARLRHHSDQSA